MSSNNEVELIVRAKNLSTKTISQLNSELDKIADNQENVADANRLAERSFESLKSEQQQLLAIMKTLNDRASKLDGYAKQEKQVLSLRNELSRARENLNTLAQTFYTTEKPSKEFTQQLKTAAGEVTRLESSLRNSERRLTTSGAKLKDMGVDTTRFEQSQKELNSAVSDSLALYQRSTSNMDKYEGAVRDVRQQQELAKQEEREQAQEARDTAAVLTQAAKEREEQARKEQRLVELTTNVYRTLAKEREKAASAGASFRATGTQAAQAARATVAPAVGSGSTIGGAAAGVQAVLEPAKSAVAAIDQLEKEVEQLEKEFAALTPEALRAADGVEKLADQSRRLREAQAALKTQAGLADELARQNVALTDARLRFEDTRRAVLYFAEAVEASDGPNDKLSASLQRAQNELKQAHTELTKQTEAFNRVQQRAAAAGITLEKLNGIEDRLAGNATRVANGQKQVAGAMVELDKATSKTNTKLNAFNSGQRTALSLYQRTRGQVLSLVSAYVGVFGAINLANQSLDAAIDRERVMSRLMIANKGDVTAAGKEYDYLRKKADELGVVFGPLAESYSRFSVAARDAGMSAEATRYIFESFSEAASVLRLSGDETAGAFRALEQIFSKGYIQAEELRGQLGDRMTGAFNLFAKAIGVSTGELNKMLEKGGQVKAEFVLLAAQTARGIYGPQAKAASNSLLGDLNRMQNAWGDLKREIIDGGTGDALRSLFVDLTKFLKSDDGKKFAENISKVFIAAAEAGRELLAVVADNDGKIKLLADTVAFLVRHFKELLAIMIAIQAARIAIVFTQLTSEMLKARAASAALNATLGAGTAASATRASASLLGLIAGPIAALIALASAGVVISIYFQMKGELKSSNDKLDVEKTIANLNRGFTASEKNLASMTRDDSAALEKRVDAAQRLLDIYDKQKKALADQIAQNTAIRKNQVAIRTAQSTREGDANLGTKQFSAIKQVEDEGKALQAQLASLEKRAEPLRGLVSSANRDLGSLKTKEATVQNDALAAEFKRIQAAADAAAKTAGTDTKAAKAAEAARKKKEAEEKRLAALAERRVRLEEDVAEKLRDIDNDIAEAKPDTLESRLAIIDNKMADRKAELERMLREAETLKVPKAAEQISKGLSSLPELANSQKQATTQEYYESRINTLLQQRQSSVESINTLQEAGLLTTSEAAKKIEEVNGRLLPQLEELRLKAEQFMSTLGDGPQAMAARASLENLSAQIKAMAVELSQQKRQVIDVFQSGFSQGSMESATKLADLLKGIDESGNAWKAFGDIVLNTIADILTQLAQLIIQQVLFNALKDAAANSSGSGWGAIISAAASYLHVGGVVGAGAGRRSSVPSYVFNNAPEYHGGGVAGFAPDEVPAMLKRNEEVLTEDDPRHRFNGGLDGATGGAAPTELTVINTIDSESVVAAGANSRAGRKAIFNAIKADQSSYKKLFS